MKTALKLFLLVSPLALNACAVMYECQLGEECYNTEDAYNAAVSGGGNSESVMPYGPVKESKEDEESEGIKQGEWQPYSGSRLTDRPVYQPPQPRRIWIAPWREDGILRAGQFIFVVQPGYWNMGQMDEDGVAAQLLSPVSSENGLPPRVQPHENLLPTSTGR